MAVEVTGTDAPLASERYDGQAAETIAARLGAPRVVLYDRVGSTMDVAHILGANGAPAGTVILADEQVAGRGRQGRSWRSAPGCGIWMTLIERPRDAAALEVLSLRIGLAAASVLDAYAPNAVQVKWPNDLFVGRGKLAGVLVEARWRNERPEWAAIGIGVNIIAPDVPGAAGLRGAPSRLDVLESLVPALRGAAARTGPLGGRELHELRARDLARGRRCVEPSAGVVLGVTSTGELAVETPAGVRYHRSGSLLLEEDA